MYKLDQYTVNMYRVSENELPMFRLLKVIIWQT